MTNSFSRGGNGIVVKKSPSPEGFFMIHQVAI